MIKSGGRGMMHSLAGFANSGGAFKFILSNGEMSTRRDRCYRDPWGEEYDGPEFLEYEIKMLPQNARIKSVAIHYSHYSVRGFEFFDNEGKQIFKLGYFCYWD